jgi:hypothetical protein
LLEEEGFAEFARVLEFRCEGEESDMPSYIVSVLYLSGFGRKLTKRQHDIHDRIESRD